MTVCGPITPEELGIVMMHEHLLHDDVEQPCWFAPPEIAKSQGWADKPVCMERLGILHRSPFAIRDNTQLTMRDPIAEELGYFASAGGGTIVELSCQGLHPNPIGLREISRLTGVHVVAGCGYYVEHSLPQGFADRTVDNIAHELIKEIREGFGSTGIRPGIIGEIGTSGPITPNEKKSLHAAAVAARETGLSVMVHLGMTTEQAFPSFDILTSEGMPADRIVMNHMDEANDLDYSRRVADLGCVIEYDTFGSEWYYDSWNTYEPRDTERVQAVATLCSEGYSNQITLSQDVFYKQSLKAYGGWGYSHILESVQPMFCNAGVTQAQLNQMLVVTPQRLLIPAGTG